MLEGLSLVPWEQLEQPAWNRPGEIPSAIRVLAEAADEKTATDAYHRFLYAVGNNHAGTYHPAVLQTIAFLGEILGAADTWPCRAALDALIDLVVSFEPEPGLETTTDAAGRSVPVSAALRGQVETLAPNLERLRTSSSDARVRELVQDLTRAIER